jgi:hypothetical protein
MLTGRARYACGLFKGKLKGRKRKKRKAVWGLLLVRFGGNGLEIFGFKNLPAIDALYIIHAITTGKDDCFLMLAGGLHGERLRYDLF